MGGINEKKYLRYILAFVLAIFLFFSNNDTMASNTQGWKNKNNSWTYVNKDGSLKKGWIYYSGKWYFLNPSTGIMETGWKYVFGKWYYLEKSGVMSTGWKYVNYRWYYLEKSGAMATNLIVGNYYITSNGKIAKNVIVNGVFY